MNGKWRKNLKYRNYMGIFLFVLLYIVMQKNSLGLDSRPTSTIDPSIHRPPSFPQPSGFSPVLGNPHPQSQDTKRVDINLNIRVDGDGNITANTYPEYNHMWGIPVLPPHYSQPFTPQPRPYFPMQAAFPTRASEPVPMPSNIRPSSPLNESQQSDKKSDRMSDKINDKISEKQQYSDTVFEDSVYCVICEEEYTLDQRQEHILKHQRNREPLGKISSKQVIEKYSKNEQLISKPIVQPEQHTVEYKPNLFILKDDRKKAEPQHVQVKEEIKEQIEEEEKMDDIPFLIRQRIKLEDEEQAELNQDEYKSQCRSSIRKRVFESDKYTTFVRSSRKKVLNLQEMQVENFQEQHSSVQHQRAYQTSNYEGTALASNNVQSQVFIESSNEGRNIRQS